MYKQFLKNPTHEREELYKKYKNKLSHSLRISKRLYFEKKLDNYKSNAKGTWKILNEVLNRRKKNSDLPSSFIIGNAVCDAPIEIAGKLCEYFSNIGPKLAEKMPNSNDTYTRFLPPQNVNSLFFDPASSQEIIHICNSLRPGIAAGYDNIPIGIVKETIDVISDPLCHIINLSITSSVVPDQLKIARVIPIFKTGDKRIFNNYSYN